MRRNVVPTCCATLALACIATAARAQDETEIELFDADGDGDIDDDDRAILEAAEQIEIVDKSEAVQQRESARAVTVIDTRQARERTADLGEVLSRSSGVQVRRDGGLGSTSRLSLNGLQGDQIRFFLDGVPLHFAGWGLGIANVPVELVQRIEVHRGVVPVALGADALGGAIDLVTDPSWVDGAAASYQIGSFGTHRLTTTARVRDASTGLALGLGLSIDRATNDYPIDVEVTEELGDPHPGRVHPARVRRFHDRYAAAGASLEAGVVDRGPVNRALLRLHTTDVDKELQHNVVMSIPYGEATYGEVVRGATVDVQLERGDWRGRVLGGVARRTIDFEDLSTAVYNWYGEPVDQNRAGEIEDKPFHQRIRETGMFARLSAEYAIGEHQRVRATIAPTAATRSGTDFLDPNPGGRDPLSARRDLLQVVTGVEHDLRGFDDRLHNIGFVKHYASWTDAEDLRQGYMFVPVEQRVRRFGIGDSVRYRLSPRLALKASYEWATRLPTVDEVFGDGVLIQPNLALAPERSHNANLGAQLGSEGRFGAVSAEANLFARLADNLILVLGTDHDLSNYNVFAARILGVEGTAGWQVPGEWASVDGSVTVQDIRNASDQGTFGAYEGDRLPNRPWLLGSLAGTVRRRDLVRDRDELALFANSRYVHEFFRGWESAGLRRSKQVVEWQLVHSVGLTYAMRGATSVVTTLELANVTDASAFDSYGVQRPGRALYLKISAEL